MAHQNVFAKFANLNKFDCSSPDEIINEFEKLLAFEINSVEELINFVEKRDVVTRHYANKWSENHFLVSTDVSNETFKNNNDLFNKNITPIVSTYGNKLDQKFLSSPYIDQLNEEFDIYIKNLQSRMNIYCFENTKVYKRVDKLCSEITEIQGGLTTNWNGKSVPLPEIYPYLKSTDQKLRLSLIHI